MGKEQRRLKNFIIYPSFQFQMVFMCALISLIAPFLIISFKAYFFELTMEEGLMMGYEMGDPYFVFLRAFNDQFNIVFTASIGVSFLICLLLGIVVSHRVAGPVVKMRNYFDEVAKGQPEREIHFRDGDFFQDLADSYNKRFKKTDSQP